MSPRLIGGAGFAVKLDHPQKNRDHTAAFLAQGTEAFELPGYTVQAGYQLRRSLAGDQIRLIFDGETAYYVKLEQSNNVIPGVSHVTQVGVWRSADDRYESAVTGFARRVFSWLVENYNVVISDNEQTRDGKRFWMGRLRQSITRPDRHVYAWDGTNEDAEPVEITEVTDLLERWEPLFWGTDLDEHTYRLFIITSKPLQVHAQELDA